MYLIQKQIEYYYFFFKEASLLNINYMKKIHI